MNQNKLILPSFAKINLSLRVLGKRDDGFHELWTVFQTVSLKDTLTFSKSDEFILESNNENIPTNESNLIIKAGNILADRFKVQKGARIYLDKNIPFPGGLGGGSSNAAIALLGLATFWELEIRFDELCEIGSEIGSDVPFFFYGGTAIGKGRGTELSRAKDLEKKSLLIVTPNIEISTAEAYTKLNAQDLTNIDAKSILRICRDEATRLESGHLNFTNDFEESVFKIEPKIKQIKNKLLKSDAKEVLLSGSGASVFAIFDNEEKRQNAINAFDKKDLRLFAVKTISRLEYRKHLEPCKFLLPN